MIYKKFHYLSNNQLDFLPESSMKTFQKGQNHSPPRIGTKYFLFPESHINTGKWNHQEIQIFNQWYQSLEAIDKKWEILAEMIKTRTPAQVRSHTQKFFEKIERDKNKIGRRPGDLQLAKENSSIRKTRGMTAKVKRTSDDNYQQSDYPVQKRLNYIIISPPMQYDTMWRDQKDSEVKINQISKAPTVADHWELGSHKKIRKEKRGRHIALKPRQQRSK